ncbi:MAG: hypothetical protein OEV49_03615 [candidate division Zixibacteria bacterium]|nr:hypothetical protein [candidate division Zixibacteria bacterium]MDH3938908.1 hypothetical protein [candidate division Zixibacteria bacterium]MDH4034758.1 hypothetical protein [candidate division Zixibacteria bacterium]
MTYFEIKERLAVLLEFRRLYSEYLDFTNRFSNPAAEIVRGKMEPLAAMTVDSLKRVKLGSMLTRNAPAEGGKKIRINLIRAIFRDKVIRDYNLDDGAPMKVLDTGIVKYRTRLWQQKIQLFNPVFWLLQVSAYLPLLPLNMLRKAGYDVLANEEAPLVRVLVLLFQVLCFYVLFKSTGLIDWFIGQLLS